MFTKIKDSEFRGDVLISFAMLLFGVYSLFLWFFPTIPTITFLFAFQAVGAIGFFFLVPQKKFLLGRWRDYQFLRARRRRFGERSHLFFGVSPDLCRECRHRPPNGFRVPLTPRSVAHRRSNDHRCKHMARAWQGTIRFLSPFPSCIFERTLYIIAIETWGHLDNWRYGLIRLTTSGRT